MNNPSLQILISAATKNACYHEERSTYYVQFGDKVVERYDPEKPDEDGNPTVTMRYEKRESTEKVPRLKLIDKANGWDLAVRHQGQAVDYRADAARFAEQLVSPPETVTEVDKVTIQHRTLGAVQVTPETYLWHRGFRRYSSINPKAYVGLDRYPE